MTGLDDRFTPPERFVDASDQLHDLVAQQLGSDDFGGNDYLPGLKMLLLSTDYDARLSPLGKRIAWGEIYGGLFARAHSIKEMKAHPGFDSHPILAPVVIAGIPRSGTTALHKLLAVDPRFQGIQTWLIAAPQPRPSRETWAANPHFQNQVAQLQARYAAQPDLKVAHNMVADEVDECLGVLKQSFVSNLWTSAWPAANYDIWWQRQSELPSYELYARNLQLIGSTAPDKRWLLKNPSHIMNLDLLFAVFPDARVIQTHRDPAKAIPSLCTILDGAHNVFEDSRHDLHRHIIGTRETEKWAQAIEASDMARDMWPDQILDIVHGDFHRDPMGVVARIYAFIGMEQTPETRAAMAQRIADKPELAHGTHHYDLADYGLIADGVRERFGDYVERFDLVEKRA